MARPLDAATKGRLAQGAQRLFSFPDPVNEVAARIVAAGVVIMAVVGIVVSPWAIVALAYGFGARVLTGPTLSPLGQLATRVGVPLLGLEPRPTPGPPKRFAQGIGAAFSFAALFTWAAAGWPVGRWILVPLCVAAFLETALNLCLGCRIFSLLMAHGVIPKTVCPQCADLSRRHRQLARTNNEAI
ncbi:MAG: DUF4395 domain-containing protein [Acidimicrobiales bacterium]